MVEEKDPGIDVTRDIPGHARVFEVDAKPFLNPVPVPGEANFVSSTGAFRFARKGPLSRLPLGTKIVERFLLLQYSFCNGGVDIPKNLMRRLDKGLQRSIQSGPKSSNKI